MASQSTTLDLFQAELTALTRAFTKLDKAYDSLYRENSKLTRTIELLKRAKSQHSKDIAGLQRSRDNIQKDKIPDIKKRLTAIEKTLDMGKEEEAEKSSSGGSSRSGGGGILSIGGGGGRASTGTKAGLQMGGALGTQASGGSGNAISGLVGALGRVVGAITPLTLAIGGLMAVIGFFAAMFISSMNNLKQRNRQQEFLSSSGAYRENYVGGRLFHAKRYGEEYERNIASAMTNTTGLTESISTWGGAGLTDDQYKKLGMYGGLVGQDFASKLLEAGKSNDPETVFNAIAEMVEALAKAGYLTQARELSQMLTGNSGLADLYNAIVKKYADRMDLSEAEIKAHISQDYKKEAAQNYASSVEKGISLESQVQNIATYVEKIFQTLNKLTEFFLGKDQTQNSIHSNGKVAAHHLLNGSEKVQKDTIDYGSLTQEMADEMVRMAMNGELNDKQLANFRKYEALRIAKGQPLKHSNQGGKSTTVSADNLEKINKEAKERQIQEKNRKNKENYDKIANEYTAYKNTMEKLGLPVKSQEEWLKTQSKEKQALNKQFNSNPAAPQANPADTKGGGQGGTNINIYTKQEVEKAEIKNGSGRPIQANMTRR